MSYLNVLNINKSETPSNNKFRKLLIILIFFLILLFITLLTIYLKGEKSRKEELENPRTQTSVTTSTELSLPDKINNQLYDQKGFSKVIEQDNIWPGYLLKGFTDGEIIKNEFMLPGLTYKNKLAIKFFYLDKDQKLNSIIVPIIISENEKIVILDQFSLKILEEKQINNDEEKFTYFTNLLKDKKNKIMSVSLRPIKETASLEDLQSDIWNKYFLANKDAYMQFINSGDPKIEIILPRSLDSNLVNDSFFDLQKNN